MPTVTQVNGLTTLNVDYNFTNIQQFNISIPGADSTWFGNETADGAIIEIIVTKYNPLRYKASKNGNNGSILMWLEGVSWTAAGIQAEIRALGNSVGVNGIDLTAVDVALAAFS